MNSRKIFEIPFVSLKPGVHEYTYEITDKFFAEYETQDFSECNAHVKLSLEKNTNFMLLRFEIGGTVKVVCDRCGNNLPVQLWEDFNIVVKLVENPDVMNDSEEDPDIYYISLTESHLYVGDWIYEFINLSIPMQRMCNEEQMGGPNCNVEVLKKLGKMKPSASPERVEDIWKGLEQFKNLPEE